jgi:hypothetical protein
MRRQSHYLNDSAPRADGGVIFGMVAVLIMAGAAFLAHDLLPQERTEAARAYLLQPGAAEELAVSEIDETTTSAISAAPGEAPACNIAACGQAYRSFDAADCTYQPFDGARRICTR